MMGIFYLPLEETVLKFPATLVNSCLPRGTSSLLIEMYFIRLKIIHFDMNALLGILCSLSV